VATITTDTTCETCVYGSKVPESIEFYDTILWDCSHPVPKGYNGYRHYLRAIDSTGCACWCGYAPVSQELLCRGDEVEMAIQALRAMRKKGV
jgi:hypothetical protein